MVGHMSEPMVCPRRIEVGADFAAQYPRHDKWRKGRGGARTCSWCGSLHPDYVMESMRFGSELGPTDKSYKVYLPDGKFYFQHLSEDQRREFVELYNERPRRQYDDRGGFEVVADGTSQVAVGFPGYFYVLPFFMGPRA